LTYKNPLVTDFLKFSVHQLIYNLYSHTDNNVIFPVATSSQFGLIFRVASAVRCYLNSMGSFKLRKLGVY